MKKSYKKPLVRSILTNHKTNDRLFGMDASNDGCGMCKVFS